MNKKTKVASSILALMIFGSVLAGCSSGDSPESSSQQKGQEKKEDKSLRITTAVVGGKTPEENTLFQKEIERLTGIKTTINKLNPADYNQKLMASMTAGEKFDLMQVSKELMNQLVAQGVLSPLTDQIKGSKVLQDPDVLPVQEWDQIKTKDGKVYGVFTKFQGGTMPIVRNDWLKKLNLQEPKTLDEYYNVLKAFVEQDPDGNGKKDTYGLSTAGMYELQGFFSSAGLKQRYVEKDGKLDVPYSTDAAIPVYEWLNKLYKEGILDPNFASNDSGKMRNLFLADRVGMITYWDAWVGTLNNTRLEKDPNTTFQAKGLPGAVGPDGKNMLRRGDPDVWVIPVNAEHPKTAFEFIEWWHSKDGITLGSLGIKDNDYTESNGKYELTKAGKEHAMDHGVPFWYNKKVEPPFGLLPGVKEAQDLVMKYASLELTPPQWPDAEKIINEYSFKAILGEMKAADAVKKMREQLKAKKLID